MPAPETRFVDKKIERQLVGWTSNNVLAINSYVLDQANACEFIHDQLRIRRARVAIGTD
jgi:hypothetical protein